MHVYNHLSIAECVDAHTRMHRILKGQEWLLWGKVRRVNYVTPQLVGPK